MLGYLLYFLLFIIEDMLFFYIKPLIRQLLLQFSTGIDNSINTIDTLSMTIFIIFAVIVIVILFIFWIPIII